LGKSVYLAVLCPTGVLFIYLQAQDKDLHPSRGSHLVHGEYLSVQALVELQPLETLGRKKMPAWGGTGIFGARVNVVIPNRTGVFFLIHPPLAPAGI
jgi:hypothetical protein